MKFTELRLPGAFLLEHQRLDDDRGFFTRTFCAREYAAHGLNPQVVQCNVSHNLRRGTLRGLHWQEAPYGEAKRVTCIAGAIFDVIVDLREGSPTYRQWVSVELTAETGSALYVPEGFAHGFQTLHDATRVEYQMSAFFEASAARGLRWNDPALGISWPVADPILSTKDRGYPLLTPSR